VIKIDKAFVKASGRGLKSSALLRAIVGLGHSLGVEIVAEGIENPAQAKWFRSLGCQYAQGYWFAEPLTAPDAAAFLAVHGRVDDVAEPASLESRRSRRAG